MLTTMGKWTYEVVNLERDVLVYVCEDKTSTVQGPLAKFEETLPETDGSVRVCKTRNQNGIFSRPEDKPNFLPIHSDVWGTGYAKSSMLNQKSTTRVDLTYKSYYATLIDIQKTTYGNAISFLFFFFGHSMESLSAINLYGQLMISMLLCMVIQ